MTQPASTPLHASDTPPTGAARSSSWGSFLGGVVLGSATLFAVAAQPVFQRLQALQNTVAGLHEDVSQLVGARDQAFHAGNLLADLNLLKSRTTEARSTLQTLQQLQEDLVVQGRQSTEVSAALAELLRVQSALVEQRDMTTLASQAVADIARVQKQLRDEQAAVADSTEALAGLTQARQDLRELVELKNQLVEQGRNVPDAQHVSSELIVLKDRLIADGGNAEAARGIATQLLNLKTELADQAGTVGAARDAASELLEMKKEILEQSAGTEEAQTQANRMILMQQELVSHGADSPGAFRGLDQLIGLKDRLLEQTPAVADAVQNVELLSDFRQELDGQIKSLDGMRQTLLQLALLEPTIQRVASTIAPLADLANIRRLSESDLRAAARSIMDNRSPRLSSNPLPAERVTGQTSEAALRDDDKAFEFPTSISEKFGDSTPLPLASDPLPGSNAE